MKEKNIYKIFINIEIRVSQRDFLLYKKFINERIDKYEKEENN